MFQLALEIKSFIIFELSIVYMKKLDKNIDLRDYGLFSRRVHVVAKKIQTN